MWLQSRWTFLALISLFLETRVYLLHASWELEWLPKAYGAALYSSYVRFLSLKMTCCLIFQLCQFSSRAAMSVVSVAQEQFGLTDTNLR